MFTSIKFTGTESSPILLCNFYKYTSKEFGAGFHFVYDSAGIIMKDAQAAKCSLVPRPSLLIAILFAPSPMENTGPRIVAWSLASTDHFGHLAYFQSHECRSLVTLKTVAPMERKWVNKASLMPSGEIVCWAN